MKIAGRYYPAYQDDIGKPFLSRDGTVKGKIVGVSTRWCAACQRVRPRYSVDWEDGSRTYPCPAGCKDNPDGTVQIV